MRWVSMFVLSMATSFACAQDAIPAGTVIPAALQTTISSASAKPGDVITARVMQDVPTGHGVIHAGSKFVGRVVQVSGSSVALQFSAIREAGREVPVSTQVRAMASFVAVEDAQIPGMGPDEGTSPNAWTTVQIGGDVVYRGGGTVERGGDRVGTPVSDGVLSRVNANAEGQCRGETDGNSNPQALWVFSSDACGVYGLSNLHIVKKGSTDPTGSIVLSSDRGALHVPRGTGLLLRVITPAENSAQGE